MEVARDVLRVAPKTNETEVEFRFKFPGFLFDTVHGHWKAWCASSGEFTTDTVWCNNDSDLRRVNENWERKRLIDRVRLPIAGKLKCDMCVSVESAARAPENTSLWNIVRHRKRWSYQFSAWIISWTKVGANGEVEVEYSGNPEKLSNSENLCDLTLCFPPIIACLAFLIDCSSYATIGKHANYVQSQKNHCTSGIDNHKLMKLCMSKQQPVSLIANRSRRLSDVCVSLKLDGYRAMMYFDNKFGVSVCWMMLRTGQMYSVPCLDVDVPMILDGEIMGNKFVAFDIVSVNNRVLNYVPFRSRLNIMRSTCMPTMLTLVVQVKTFYSINFPDGFVEKVSADGVDGVIIHNMQGYLHESQTMYKWKNHHTIDVHVVNNKCHAENKPLDFQLSKPTPDGLWECKIVDGTLLPVKKREDKKTANSHRVCQEIYQAHKQNVQLLDIPAIFIK